MWSFSLRMDSSEYSIPNSETISRYDLFRFPCHYVYRHMYVTEPAFGVKLSCIFLNTTEKTVAKNLFVSTPLQKQLLRIIIFSTFLLQCCGSTSTEAESIE